MNTHKLSHYFVVAVRYGALIQIGVCFRTLDLNDNHFAVSLVREKIVELLFEIARQKPNPGLWSQYAVCEGGD